MDSSELLAEKIRSNILVQEEGDYAAGILDAVVGRADENPGEVSPLYKRFMVNLLPLVRALVVVTFFLVNGIGFSPIGCKTQYLFTSKFWYNKQLVIFFIIYFIINLGGYTITKLSDPRRQFYLSVGALLLFNVLARMGEVWFDKHPSYWPGPLTYFGLVVFPLISIYVVDDMRRYLTINYALNTSKTTIDNLKKVEIGLIAAVALIMTVGFIKAIIESKEKTGKNFDFILFLFGAPMALKGTKKVIETACSTKLFNKFNKETNFKTVKSSGIRALLSYFMIIIMLIVSGFLITNKKEVQKFFKDKLTPLKTKNKRLKKKAENQIN